MTFAFSASDPTALAEGRYPAPAWLILALGALVVAGAAVYLVLRLRASKKGPR